MINTKRFKALIILMTAIVLITAGCSRKADTNNNVSMYDLQKAMTEADNRLPEMISVNSSSENASELFAYFSDLDYDKVGGFFLVYSSTGLADEIAVISLKNNSDADAAVFSLKNHVKGRVSLYQSYLPEQADRAENALVFSRGNYAVLIISDNQDVIRSAFENMVAVKK